MSTHGTDLGLPQKSVADKGCCIYDIMINLVH